MAKGKTHRAWSILVACCFLMMTLGLSTTVLGFFIEPVSTDLGFDRSAFSLYYSIAGIAGMLSMPVWGRIFNRIGVRKSVVIAGVMTSVFMALLGVCRTLPAFYVAGAGMGLGVGAIAVLPTSVLINTWFVDKRGFAMGLAMAFSGVAGTIFSPVISAIIESAGWSVGYFVNAVLIFLFTVPVSLLLVRDNPAQYGLTAYGADKVTEQGETKVVGVTAKRAYLSLAFVVLALVVVLINAVGGILQSLPAHLTNVGIDATTASLIVSVVTISLIFAKIVLGTISDKFGLRVAVVGSFCVLALGCLIFAFVDGVPSAVVAAIVFGLGMSCITVLPPLITSEMFGNRDYSAIYSVVSALASLGLAIGVPVIALDYDLTGNYVIAFIVCAVIMVVSALLVLVALKSSKKLWSAEDQEEQAA